MGTNTGSMRRVGSDTDIFDRTGEEGADEDDMDDEDGEEEAYS